jgi:pimeloyl-ACP methyl ester carboxylesterase
MVPPPLEVDDEGRVSVWQEYAGGSTRRGRTQPSTGPRVRRFLSTGVALTAAMLGVAAAAAAGQTPSNTTPANRAEATSSVTLTTPTGTLSGTLTVPEGSARIPVALIIAGSGPTDRYGNSPMLPGRNNAYKQLAEALAADGVASLRYDKRGIAASRAAGATESALRFDMYADDAAAWIDELRRNGRFSRVIVIGHSEGSLIGMLAAKKAHADAFVSIAGVARRASDVLRDQLRPQIGSMPALWEGSEFILGMLEKGTTVETLPAAVVAVPPVASLYRPSVQPYMISWLKYVPSQEIAALSMPVLLIQGTTDIQVAVEEAKALKAAKPDAELVLIEGMNHVMKTAPADRALNAATYSNPDLPIVPDVPAAILLLARRISKP